MNLRSLLDKLGYSDSPNFLRRGTKALQTAPDYAHIFRHAEEKPCRLQGVYALRSPDGGGGQIVPIVYVCKADTEKAADELHRLVWNQDVVPFILVYTPEGIKIYSGFCFQQDNRGEASGVLRQLTRFNQVSSIVELFQASSIDDGQIWKNWGNKVTPQHRVYWELLGSLRKLDKWFDNHGLTDKEIRHALIGKYVYLHYLRDRKILSHRKFDSWEIDPASVFGGTATRAGLEAVVYRLDNWLNGSVFPLKLRGTGAPEDTHIQRVAATFAGDEIVGDSAWQLHLAFRAYDFSYIPIETLSMIYEQFLHVPDREIEEDDLENDEPTRGRKAGAYYTPIPVVNFMLAELEEHRPLQRGMRVFDPACGSGAFLVQCYRRLIEKEFLAKNIKPTPHQLSGLLANSIYGTDYDGDACSVTELSLVLTLLDYVEPPDLEDGNHPGFKLPRLRGCNIFRADFFRSKRGLLKEISRRRFDWIAGNPPWKRLDPKELEQQDRPAWMWMEKNSKRLPVGGNQLAQAFAWECRRYLRPRGECALLMPAMCLFEDPSRRFRAAFFRKHRVHTVANFSNLAEVLFAGRSRVPAAAFFFASRPESRLPVSDEFVTTFSPMVANQEVTKPIGKGIRNESWALLVNGSEVRELPLSELAEGSGLPWKLAAWGSSWDSRVLSKLSRRWPSLEALVDRNLFTISEGLQLRMKPPKKSGDDQGEPLEELKDLGDKEILDVNQLKEYRDVFVFPKSSIKRLDPRLKYARKGRSELPLSVCRPPHVIVSAARNFAVFSDRYIIVPPRQIGVVSPSDDTALLKAFAVYLSSDFAFYHQFLTSTQFGVQRGRATLEALRKIPIPFATYKSSDLEPWVELHYKLATLKPRLLQVDDSNQTDFFDKSGEQRKGLLDRLNKLVNDALCLDDRERVLVHDLVHVRLALNDGKLGDEAVRKPDQADLEAYARYLQRELNDFIGDDLDRHHAIAIVHDNLSGMVEVDFTKNAEAVRDIKVLSATRDEAKALEQTRRRLRQERAQWVYFDRSLRIYEGRRTYILKPMQRFQWTESQAMVDASEIIAETLAARAAKE